ncbi:ankyrin repeat protein [Megavirus baoshan]|uniref:Ankyrin repeat protein n=1 Tax=Megavirus baoshan TaxID=2496520 RepID=A0A3Q8U8Y1_9VIRU|nr:ankyrin repeat protein [Megavirus baoshan]AZL90014.1 ankyrin repeat protein [Megavirus baoshan]
MGASYSNPKSEANIINLVLSEQKNNYVENIRYFCERNPEKIDNPSTLGWSALMYACYISNKYTYDIIRILIDYGANVNFKDNIFNVTPLILACNIASKSGNNEIIYLLLERGAQINVQDNNGNTALMHACYLSNEYNNMNIIKYILECGADIYIKNNSGETAKDIIESCYRDNYISIIRKMFKN